MVKKVALFIVFFSLTFFCQEKGSNGVKEFLEKLQKFQEGINTLKVQFTQVNDFAMLQTPEVLKGTIYITKPSKVFYLYEKPDKLYYLVKDGELLIYNPKKKEATLQDVERYQNKIMKYLGATIPIKELERKFDMEILEENGIFHLSFKPKKKSLSKRLSDLDFYINKDDLTINKIEIKEPEGDKVSFEFEKWEINPELDEKVFDLKIPKGVKIKKGSVNIKEPFEEKK